MSRVPIPDFLVEFKGLRDKALPKGKYTKLVVGRMRSKIVVMGTDRWAAICCSNEMAEYLAVCSQMVDVLAEENEILNEELAALKKRLTELEIAT